jgi:hypothetical protein
LLFGHNGAEPADTRMLAELLIRVGILADELPEVATLAFNPVLVSATGLSVLHATVTLRPPGSRPDVGPRRLR